MQNKPKATVKEIARLAGVSIGTVDRVLHDRPGVSAETRSAVAEIVLNLGYKPDILARQLSLNRDYLFRAILPRGDQDSGYWSLCRKGIIQASKNLLPYRVKVEIDEFDRYDTAAYQTLLEEVLKNPGDGLLIAPVLPDELRPALERLGGRVPIAFFDGTMEGIHPLVAIGQDAFRAGYLAGRLLSLLVPGTKPLVAINTHEEDRHIRQRVAGFQAFFSEREEYQDRRVVVMSCFEIEKEENCSEFLAALFKEEPETAGILVANASGHSVGDWLVRAGRKKACALVCWDFIPANEAALRNGSLDCIVSQRPFDQGKEGMERLYGAVVRGEREERVLRIPIEIYFKENLPPEDSEMSDGF